MVRDDKQIKYEMYLEAEKIRLSKKRLKELKLELLNYRNNKQRVLSRKQSRRYYEE